MGSQGHGVSADRAEIMICADKFHGRSITIVGFSSEHENVRPDGVILGKALGGGPLPVSARVGTSDLMQVFMPGDHGSTFGGNPLAALEGLFVEGMIARSAELGEHLLARLPGAQVEGFAGRPQ